MPRSLAPYPLFDRVCTLFCPDGSDEAVIDCAASITPNLRASFLGGKSAWKAITLKGAGSTLVLNKTKFVRPGFKGPGGAFNRVTLGAGAFFRDVRVRPKDIRERLLDQISATALLVGCVATPELSPELGHYDLVFAIARATNGLIFDGQGMLDGNGTLVLDSRGRHDIAVWPR